MFIKIFFLCFDQYYDNKCILTIDLKNKKLLKEKI